MYQIERYICYHVWYKLLKINANFSTEWCIIISVITPYIAVFIQSTICVKHLQLIMLVFVISLDYHYHWGTWGIKMRVITNKMSVIIDGAGILQGLWLEECFMMCVVIIVSTVGKNLWIRNAHVDVEGRSGPRRPQENCDLLTQCTRPTSLMPNRWKWRWNSCPDTGHKYIIISTNKTRSIVYRLVLILDLNIF